MSLAEAMRVAFEALSTNKLRSALTMIGIIVGVGSVIAIIAIGRGTQAAVVGELEGISTGLFSIAPAQPRPGAAIQRTEPLTEVDLANIRRLLPGVAEVITSLDAMAPVKDGPRSATAAITGTYAAAPSVLAIKVAQGRWFTGAEESAGARVVVVGSDVPEKLLGSKTAGVGRTISIGGYPFEVIGITEKSSGALSRLAGGDDLSYWVPIGFLRKMTGERTIRVALVKVRPGVDTQQVMKDAVALVERNHRGAAYEGLDYAQFTSAIGKITSIITGVLAAIAGISLVVGGVGIMNIMLVSVAERTREIGVRKAIGASYRDILVQFLIEAVVLSLIGGAIGLLIAALPVWAVGRWMKIPLLIDWKSVALAMAFSVGTGVLFGVYPAARAARLSPIEALRYE